MVVGIACPGLARAEQRCRRGLLRFDSPRQLAGVGGRRSDRHGQPLFSGRQLQIGDLGHRGQSVTQVFSTLPCFVPRTPINTDSSAVGCRRAVPTERDAGLPRHNVIFSRLVSTRQGRARTLGNGLLGEGLLLDRDGVGGDHGVFVIVECEHLGRNSHTDGIAFTAITVHYDTHASLTSL